MARFEKVLFLNRSRDTSLLHEFVYKVDETRLGLGGPGFLCNWHTVDHLGVRRKMNQWYVHAKVTRFLFFLHYTRHENTVTR